MNKQNNILTIAHEVGSDSLIPESFAVMCSVVFGRFCIEYGNEDGVVPIEWLEELKDRISIKPETMNKILSWLQERRLMTISKQGTHLMYGYGEEAELQLQQDIISKEFFDKYEELLDMDIDDDELERRGAELTREAKKKLLKSNPNADLSIFDLNDSEEC